MSFSVHKINNLVRQEATPSQQDYWKEIIRFGDFDNFPLRLARLVQNSPTASSCIDTKADFIEGAGFSDETISDLKINVRGERFGDLHGQNSSSQALFEGFAINVKYNVKGAISELYHVPFENCRFAPPDSKGVITKIRVNPYFGTGEYRQQYTKDYDVYNPDLKAVLAQQERDKGKYKGQILYVASTGPLSPFYPAPKYYSCSNWMAIDEAIGGFHKHNIENGFFQSVFMTVFGDEAAPSSHPDDMIWNETTNQYDPDPRKTNGYRWNLEMQKFSGWEKAGNMMTFWTRMKEEAPLIQPFQSATNAELFKTLQEITTEQIARATKVPSVLANISSGASLGGDGNNIRASVKLSQQRAVKTHGTLERAYKDLLSHFEKPFTGDVKILHYNPFPEMEKIDPLIWAALPIEVQRAWINKNTDFKIPDAVLASATPTPAPAPTVKNSFQDVFYADYPSKAKEIAQKAKDFREKSGSNCGGKAGWQTCEDIISGRPLSYKMIRRIYNYLNKNQGFASHVFTDSCESVLFSAWGGNDMLNWAAAKITSINE